MSRRTATAAACAVLAVLAVAGCGSARAAGTGGDGRIPIVASTNVWASVAGAVGGDRVRVSSLIDSPAKDPHDYEPSAADAARTADAKLTVYNGGGYDDFFAKAVRAGGGSAPSVNAFAVSGKRGPDANEHVFYDLPSVQRVAAAVAARLGRIDPTGADRYARNARAFSARLDGLTAEARGIGKGARASAVATEPVAGYLLATARVRDATPDAYAEAVESDQDVPATGIAAAARAVRGRAVRVLVDNAQAETPTSRQLVELAGRSRVPVVRVTETLPDGVTDYVRWMGAQIGALRKAVRDT